MIHARTGCVMADAGLQQSVLDELEWDPGVAATDTGISADDGVVALRGFLGGYAEKWAAERVVERVAVVKAIAGELKVRLFDYNRIDNETAAKRAVQLIAYDPTPTQAFDDAARTEA